MSTAILLSEATRLSRETRACVEQLRDTHDRMSKLHDALEARTTQGSWSFIESEFGLQAGDGQSFYNLMAGAWAALQVSDVTSLLSRVS